MTKAHYLILAHESPENVAALVKTLQSENVYIHIDAKSAIEPFKRYLPEARFLEPRISVNWGGWSIQIAITELIKAARPHMSPGDYAILLSGDSYPLVNSGAITRFLEENHGFQYIDCAKMIAPEHGKPLYRILMYYIEFDAKGKGLLVKPMNFFNRVLRKLTPRNWRKAFREMDPYGGSTWWMLTTEALDFIFSEMERRPDFVRFCMHTHLPDEHFFHTLIANSHFAPEIKPSLLFHEFVGDSPFASILTLAHIDELRSKGLNQVGPFGATTYLFARKVRSQEVRDSIEKLW